MEQLPQFHQGFSGLSEVQAEVQFIKEAQKLPEYGLHFYKVYTVSKISRSLPSTLTVSLDHFDRQNILY